MWLIPIAIVAALLLWIIALNLDSWLFGGQFLVRAKTTPGEFRKAMEAILSQTSKPIEEWDEYAADWINDKICIPLSDPALDQMRENILRSLKGEQTSTLSPETTQLIKKICTELSNRVSIANFISAIREDARLQRQSNFDKMGHRFEEFDSLLPTDHLLRRIPLTFWDSWLDERNHGFIGHYKGIGTDEWPVLAELIASSLEKGIPITDPRVTKHFGPE